MEFNKKYTVKSKTLPDTWVFKYDLTGSLVCFECHNTKFDAKRNHWLMEKGRFPYNESRMKHWVEAFKKQFIIEIDLPEITFEYFYERYGKKVGRKQSHDFWKKMKDGDRLLSVLGIPLYETSLRKQKDREKVDPVRYLKHRRYEDEY